MKHVLEFLRNRRGYKQVVTSSFFRLLLRGVPAKFSFRLLKRLGPVAVRIRVGRVKFWLVTSSEDDHYLSALLHGLRNWETESLKAWSEVCSLGGTVVDVGAYGGVYSALAVSAGADRVVAYEPNPAMFERLSSTITKNRFDGQVELRNFALADVASEEVLMVLEGRPSSSGAHLASGDSDPAFEWSAGPSVTVRTLDEDLLDLGVDEVASLKIDAEGAEFRVLSGAIKTLSYSKPSIVVELLDLESFEKLTQLLNDNYTVPVRPLLDSRSLGARGDRVFCAGNYLFVTRRP